MKRLLITLIILIILPACACAFDLSPYEIDSVLGTAADLTAGQINDLTSLEGHPYRLFRSGSVYIGFHETEGEPAQFMLYDRRLTCFARGQLPSARADLCSLSPDGDAAIVSLILPMKPRAQMLAARIGQDGLLDWQYMADYDALSSTIVLPDGTGGAWLSTQVVDPSSYDPYAGTRLTHMNAQGEIEFSRILKTGEEILLVHSAVSHPEQGYATLLCSLVAKSKDVYTALAVTLDPSGSILHTQARDFSMRKDIDFGYRIDADGTPYVYSRSMRNGGKGVLVPFDDLPALSPPSLSLQ